MSSFIRKALSATLATAVLGAAAIAVMPTAASADVLMARSECIGGFWHVVSYDVTDPDHWVVVSDEATAQVCGTQALALDLMAGFGHALIHDIRHDERRDFRGDERRDVRRDDRRDDRPVRPEVRTER